jgi:hypothetical protein
MTNKKVEDDIDGLVPLSKETALALYEDLHVQNAMRQITEEMDLYEIGKLSVVVEAAYGQGKKAGRREVTESLEDVINEFSPQNGSKTRNGKKHTDKVIEGEVASSKR